jgi:hypothetical protein
MVNELGGAVVVEFPLRGERWVAVNTPGDRIPSHGTDMLGQRFAYDLLMVDTRRGLRYHPAGILRGFLIGYGLASATPGEPRSMHLSTARSYKPPMASPREAGSIRCSSRSSLSRTP